MFPKPGICCSTNLDQIVHSIHPLLRLASCDARLSNAVRICIYSSKSVAGASTWFPQNERDRPACKHPDQRVSGAPSSDASNCSMVEVPSLRSYCSFKTSKLRSSELAYFTTSCTGHIAFNVTEVRTVELRMNIVELTSSVNLTLPYTRYTYNTGSLALLIYTRSRLRSSRRYHNSSWRARQQSGSCERDTLHWLNEQNY